MTIFETNRLIIKTLEQKDLNDFSELLTDPTILELIPQQPFSEAEVLERFNNNLNVTLEDIKTKKCVCGIFEKNNQELIGLSLFLLNEDGNKELGYRFKERYWKKGYGTETTKAMLDYYFLTLNEPLVSADANVANVGSIKILSKFMTPIKEFFNENDNCMDRRFQITKGEWLK